MTFILIPVAVVVVVGLIGLVAYLIKSTKGARESMDEGKRLQQELQRDVEESDSSDDS